MNTEEWQNRRSKFNHLWFKKAYIPAISSWIKLLNEEIEDPDLEKNFAKSIFTQWEEYSGEVFSLIESFPVKMSPAILFDRYPLKRCNKQSKEWLSELVHNLWLFRYPVRDWIKGALDNANEVEREYILISKTIEDIQNSESKESFKPLKNLFMSFRKSCQDLAESFEKFPDEVKVA